MHGFGELSLPIEDHPARIFIRLIEAVLFGDELELSRDWNIKTLARWVNDG